MSDTQKNSSPYRVESYYPVGGSSASGSFHESHECPIVSLEPSCKRIKKTHYALLVILVMSLYVGMMAQMTICSQYIYHRYAEEAGLSGYGMNDSVCNVNESDPNYQIQKDVQRQSSRLSGYASLANGLPGLVSVLVLGTYSDIIGRKVSIAIPWIGIVLQSLVMCLMMLLHWPIWIYPISMILRGIGGSDGAFISGVLSILADTTKKKERSIAISLFEVSIGLSNVMSQLLVGFWIKWSGFHPPFFFSTALFLSCIVYLIFIPETSPDLRENRSKLTQSLQKIRHKTPLEVLKNGLQCFTRNPARCVLLLLCLFAYFIHLFVYIGLMGVTTIYLLSLPFCWDSVDIGYFRSGITVSTNIGLLLTVYLLRDKLSDVYLVMGGFISLTACYVLWSCAYLFPDVAARYAFLYGGTVVGVFSGLCVPLLRSMTSKLMLPNEQSTLFACFANMETLGIMMGGATLNAIYEASLSFMPGFVYIFTATMTLIGAVLMITFRIKGDSYDPTDSDPLVTPNNEII